MSLLLKLVALMTLLSIAFADRVHFAESSDEDITPWGVRPEEDQSPWSAQSIDFKSKNRIPSGRSPVGALTMGTLPRARVVRFDNGGVVEPMFMDSLEKELSYSTPNIVNIMKFGSLQQPTLASIISEVPRDDKHNAASPRSRFTGDKRRRSFGRLNKPRFAM